MALYDKKAYKNPRIPRGGEVTGAGQRAESAPPRAGGMLQMAAQARARQPKQGAPSIPDTRAFRPDQRPSESPPAVRPQTAYGAARQDDKNRQEWEKQKLLYEKQKDALSNVRPQTAPTAYGAARQDDMRRRAAKMISQRQTEADEDIEVISTGLGMGGGGGEEPTPAGGIQQYGTELGRDTLPGTGTEALPDVGATPGEALTVRPTGPDDEEGGDAGPPPGFSYATEIDPESGFSGEQIVDEEAGAKKAEASNWSPAYNEEGAIIGYYDDQGNFYDSSGNPDDVPDDAVSVETSKKKQESDRVFKLFADYMAEKTGIPPEELKGQIKQLEYAGVEQMMKLAQQLAARGMGASGVYAQGMGQIATQVMMGIANLKFENSKLALEEKLNKMKAYMAFHQNVLSEDNRMEIFEKMQEWEKEKHKYEKEQDALSNTMIQLNDMAALAQAWDDDALQKAFEMASATDEDGNPLYSAADIMEFIEIERDSKGVPTMKLKSGMKSYAQLPLDVETGNKLFGSAFGALTGTPVQNDLQQGSQDAFDQLKQGLVEDWKQYGEDTGFPFESWGVDDEDIDAYIIAKLKEQYGEDWELA